jgi:two-component system sensor histidine kinase/response regulator
MSASYQLSWKDGYVLAAEDSLVQAKKLKHFLDSHQITSLICRNGAEALDAARREKPALIISDVVMPVMNGLDFCSSVKRDPALRDVPFILLTSLSDPLDIIKGLQAGADNFITKPYEEEYLISRINYLLANHYIRSQGISDPGIEIVFQDEKFMINSDKKQILDLLLSVYEAAIHRNQKLIEVQRELQVVNENFRLANQELEAFARTVSHDLRSPLNGVLGFTDLLATEYTDVLDETATGYLKWIKNSASNMAVLIEDLLQFSRSASAEVMKKNVDVTQLAREIVKELRFSSFSGNYQVSIQDGIMVQADQELMRVVLTNLLGNALKYSQKRERPSIALGIKESNGKQVIFIRDNGAGFDMNKAHNLFQPFIRMHANTEFQGTGIGLSTVKRILDRHGGAIWFESVPNQGTVFFFTLP